MRPPAPRSGREPRRPAGAGRPSLRPAVAVPSLIVTLLLAAGLWAGQLQPGLAPISEIGPVGLPPEPSAPTFSLSSAFTEPVRHWSPEIHRWAADFDLPVELVAVVMTLESCGDPLARSRAGAQGLFQVMPFHFSPDENPLDPEVNARRGLAYLSRGLQLAEGDRALALAGYNGGHGLIYRSQATWPDETVRYVQWGRGILAELDQGMTASPTLQAWLDAGGASLCRRAAERQA